MWTDGYVTSNNIERMVEAWKLSSYQYTNWGEVSSRIKAYIGVDMEIDNIEKYVYRVLVPLYAMDSHGNLLTDGSKKLTGSQKPGE